jgi:hypothetical protein
MFLERRNAPRRVVNRVAQYFCDGSQLPRTCLVTDVSETGARLHSEIDMPKVFTLAVSGEGIDIKRECRVVWKIGHEMGVEFIQPRELAR